MRIESLGVLDPEFLLDMSRFYFGERPKESDAALQSIIAHQPLKEDAVEAEKLIGCWATSVKIHRAIETFGPSAKVKEANVKVTITSGSCQEDPVQPNPGCAQLCNMCFCHLEIDSNRTSPCNRMVAKSETKHEPGEIPVQPSSDLQGPNMKRFTNGIEVCSEFRPR